MIALKYGFLIALPLAFSNCKKTEMRGDTHFAKNTFESLVRGDSAVATDIDWMTLNSLGTNVGAAYVVLENDEERLKFQTGYISQFSASFRDSGGSVDHFTNWRVLSHDDNHTEVAADSSGGLLRLTVSERDSMERLSSIQIDK